MTKQRTLLLSISTFLLIVIALFVGKHFFAADSRDISLTPWLSQLLSGEHHHTKIARPVIRVETIKERGILRIATRNAPTTYYHGTYGPKGFEYDLAKDFADYLGVDIEVVLYNSVAEILAAVESQEVDFAAAGITKTASREQHFLFGPTYQEIEQQVVCNRQQKKPKTIDDLIGLDIQVISRSSYTEKLNELAIDYPDLKWTEDEEASTEELIRDVANGDADCVISDSNIVKLNQRYFPNIKTGLSISEKQSLAWVLNKNSTTLKQVLTDWFTQFKSLGQLEVLNQHYYQYVPIFDYVDIMVFYRRIDSRLPKYRADFEKYAKEHQLNWVLLAAQAYQESHWNPKAKSPTGVRGMMMLTLPTAKRVGVKSRLNAKQNIRGGAKYLSGLIRRLPKSIPENSRIWFALAAYNVGMGHLYDARNLATKLGKNPDSWNQMQEVLPLLGQKKYYQKLRYGYARGWEPVEYVKRVRHYHDILLRTEAESPLVAIEDKSATNE